MCRISPPVQDPVALDTVAYSLNGEFRQTPGDHNDQLYPCSSPSIRHDRDWRDFHLRHLQPVAGLACWVELGVGTLPFLADDPRRLRHPRRIFDLGIS